MSQHFTAPRTTPQTPARYGAAPRYEQSSPVGTRAGSRPKTNMAMAAWSLLGAWPLAVVAMIFAGSVNNKWDSGDRAGAYKAAARAKGWAIASWVFGVLIVLISLSA